MTRGDYPEFDQPVLWAVNVWAYFGGIAAGFGEGFSASIAESAVGAVALTTSSTEVRASFELEGRRYDEVETRAQAIGREALEAGVASLRSASPGPHGWSLSIGIELSRATASGEISR